MTLTRSSLVPAAVAAAALALLAGCAPATAHPGDAGGKQPVTVVLDWTPNTNHSGLYLAQSNGWFDDAGLDVTIVEPGETSGLQLLATGHADFAYSVAESLVPAREEGVDAVSVAAIIEHNTSSLIFEESSGITRPRDLAGKVYGTYGSDLENALISTLIACDGGGTELTSAPLASDDFRIGLSEHQFDYAWVFDAWDTIRLRDIDGMDVGTLPFGDYQQCIPDWYTPLLATTASTLSSDPEMVRTFLEVLTRGYQAAMNDPVAAADALLAAAPELDPALVRASADYLATRYADDPADWGRQTAATWDGFVGFLEDNSLLETGYDTDATWTNDYLPAR
ncbi:ABC transporter substrate-binding protein [Actinotalea sp. M2MS4P-6]|uniref:ABC transporter substrate-binding protein n=1 Tax=Actinotalea sp. M2MS4P-6 TaxID=2983762 RepID=UPI0021E3B005|nr:ABC transporter substrate-binding protein [Actinotalea sp. M2MS4P-6]MCV2393688.1 ABC transporter substrate-binding protein [Actinotalea sp. M2MS4P-6]